jgi:hypothetical protein
VARRVGGDNSGAELRAWLLAEEMVIFEAVTGPPQMPIDGRPPTQVDPGVGDAIAEQMALFWRPLAEGLEYRLDRSVLPPDHPARRLGDLGDALILTENDELIEEPVRLYG